MEDCYLLRTFLCALFFAKYYTFVSLFLTVFLLDMTRRNRIYEKQRHKIDNELEK